MSISVDKRTLEIAVKYDETRQEINKVTKELGEQQRVLKKLEAEKKKAEKANKNNPEAAAVREVTEKYEEQKRKVEELQKKKDALRKSLGVEGLTISELRDELRRYNYQMEHLTPGTKAFNEAKAHADALKARMKELRGQAEETKFSLSKLADGFNRFAALGATALASITGLSMTIRKATQAYAAMEEEMAQVQKYTGWTSEQVHELNEEFKKMDTRTQREELNQLAGDAGKLGITGKQALMEFVDAADKVRVALGDDLGDDAVKNIGKLAMMFGEDKTKGLRGAMLATGSAVNELAQNSTAAAGYIVDFTARMAGVGGQVGLTQAQIMGFGSVLDQNMQQLETSSTVLSQLLTKMYQQPARFAGLAGIELKKFTDLLKNDANSALLQFLDTMKKKGGFDALAPMFEEMKLNGTRATGVLSVLAKKLGDVRTAQNLATNAYRDGTSVVNEFNVQNNTVQAQVDKNIKRFKDLTVELGEKLLPVVQYTVSAGSMGIKVLKAIIDFTGKYSATIVMLGSMLAVLTGLRYADIAAEKLQVLWNEKIVVGLKKLWATIAANPWAALATAMAFVVGVMIDLIRRTQEQKKALSDVDKIRQDAIANLGKEKLMIEELVKAARDEKLSLEERHKAIEELNQIIPDYNGQLDDTTRKYKENKQALDAYLNSLVKKYEIEGAKEMLADLGRQMAEARTDLTKAQDEAMGAAALQQATGRAAAWSQAETNFLVYNTQRGERAVEQAQKRIDRLQERVQALKDTWGMDLFTGYNPGGNGEEVEDGTSSPSGGGKNKKKKKTGNKEESEARKKMKEAEALAKAEREKADLEAKQAYQQRLITDDQYHDKLLDNELAYIKAVTKARDNEHATEAEKQEAQNMLLDNLINRANEQEKRRQRNMNDELAVILDARNADLIAIAQQQLDGQIKDEKEAEQKKLEIEIDYQRERVAIIKKYGGDAAEAEGELTNLLLKKLGEGRKEALEKYEKELREYSKKHTAAETLARAKEINDKEYRDGLISYKQYQEKKTQLLEDSEKQRQDIRQQYMRQAEDMLQSASSLFSALQSREESRVDAKYKKLIELAKKQGKDTSKLEAQQEAEKNALKKKYAQKEFRMNVLKIAADTAAGIAALWKNPGWPWAIPLTAMVAASGAMQLATAKAQEQQAAGLYKGGFSEDAEGFTGDGNPKDVAGMIPVHKREFVINHQALENPVVLEMAKTIDSFQKAGKARMINSTALLQAAARGAGLEAGGFSSDSGSAGVGGGGQLRLADDQARIIVECRELLRVISEDKGLTIRDVREKIRREESLEARASRLT